MNNNLQWKRPEDFKTFRTSDPKEMLGKYTASCVLKKWNEDFIDEDTGEVVSVERSETIMGSGVLLNQDKIQEIMFSIQAGEITDVEVSKDYFILSERFTPSYMTAYVVVIHSNDIIKSLITRAKTIEEAIKIAVDFANVYNGLSTTYTPISVTPLGCSVIEDDDPCIPDNEKKPLEDKKDYYKVSARLNYVDEIDYSKKRSEELLCIITSDEVGQAKERVQRYCQHLWKEVLGNHPDNSFSIRKAMPFKTDGLVPLCYSEMYYG